MENIHLCVIWTMLRHPCQICRDVTSSHFNTSSWLSHPLTKKKRAENLAKVKTNTYHIKGISAKLLILKGELIVSPGNIQKDLLSLQKQYLFFKRCTSNQANTSLPGSWSSLHLKKKPKEETKQNNQGSIFLVAEKEQPLTETELPDTWCYLRNWSGTWACITS